MSESEYSQTADVDDPDDNIEAYAEELEETIKTLWIGIESRKQIHRQRMERVLSMLREIVIVVETEMKGMKD